MTLYLMKRKGKKVKVWDEKLLKLAAELLEDLLATRKLYAEAQKSRHF